MFSNETIPRGAPLEEEALEKHLRAVASDTRRNGRAKLHRVDGAIRRLTASLSMLRVRGDAELLTPAAIWLADNARVIEEACMTLREDLRACPSLPARNGEPRIARFAREWLSHTEARADLESLGAAVRAWQRTQPLTEIELHCLPLAARRALLLLLSSLAVESAATEKARAHAEAALTIREATQEEAFWERLSCLLQEQEDAETLGQLDRRLAEMGTSAQQLAEREHERQTRACLWTGNAIASLRALNAMDFRAMQESLSPMHPSLLKDPTGIYPRMDFASRAMYRRRAAKLAAHFHVAESTVARRALALAEECAGATLPELSGHIGYYLMDEGQPLLWKVLGKVPFCLAAQRFVGKIAATGYVALITVGSLGTTALLWLLGIRSFLVGPALLVAGEAFRQIAGLAVHRLSPPRRMARLAPDRLDDGEVLVVVPTLLTSRAQALEMVRHLSVLRLANPESRLSYLLLGDFKDSPAASEPEDEEITGAALSAIDALSEVWNGGFYFLHRKRAWSEKAGRFMGRERKRGALVALNELILHGKCEDTFAAASCDPAALQGRFELVITLDADTKLPPGTALELAGMLLHPLNRPLIVDGKRRGCAIIQPRMETSAATIHTRIARIFGGDGGFDPYTTAFSDIYQNICGEGSYAGKGIYHVRAFEEATRGKIRDNTVLSHDLLEGGLAGSSLACDVAFYDGQPASLSAWMKRLHRWTRGDWQLLPWLIPFVKGKEGWFRNPLSILNQFKIYDNLRRSLVPAATVLLLCLGVVLGEPAAFFAGLVLTHVRTLLPLSGRSFLAALAHIALLPYEAVQLLDAIGRTLYRVLISHKHLLEWMTAAEAERRRQPDSPAIFWPNYLAAAVLLAASVKAPNWLWATVPIALLWALAPMVAAWLNGAEGREYKPSEEDRALLLDISRRTFRFFDECVSADTHFLPPDNLQLEPPRGIALRTSPTNIGMYLVACVSACELSLIEADEMARRVERTVDTIEKMEKWNGHLYNWYDIVTLAPLQHLYVSSVDGGNLAGCLLLAAQALRSRLSEVDAALVTLPGRLDALAAAMDFSKLYDPVRELFFIGVDAETGLPGDSHYDLLASEARLLSYIALMRREVPLKHWHRLGRAMTQTPKGAALLSWSGTMFEYLLPTLFLKSPPRTLLGDTCLHAALAQSEALEDVPFGISESGYYAFDPQLTYQYKALGMPQLALRTARWEKVIAPYASVLALPEIPKRAIENIRRMVSLKWLASLGFYEAVDYQRERLPRGSQGFQIVQSHMAHHQGMILASICNFLERGKLTQCFSSLPQAEAYALLLEERKPTRAMLRSAPKLRAPAAAKKEPGTPPRRVRGESFPPEVQVLYGGGTTVVCDARGGSFITHNGLMFTRRRQDPLYEGGMQLYIRMASGAVLRMAKAEELWFDRSQVISRHAYEGLTAELQCFVSPLDGAAVHLLRLHASPEQALELEVASFFEVSLSTPAEDESHPTFRNLSIETERVGDAAGFARRRVKGLGEKIPLVVHAMGAEVPVSVGLETSRLDFLGRGERLDAPKALERPLGSETGSVGAVLDPCMSVRAAMRIEAGTTVCCWFITAAAESEDKARQIAAQYGDLAQVQRVSELARMQDDVNARYIGLDQAAQLAAQRMASFLFFPLAQETPPKEGRSALWPFAISGDLPLVCVRIASESQLPLVRSILRAHAYLRALGLWSDLALLSEQQGGYQRPLLGALRDTVLSGPTRDLLDVDAGVHLIDTSERGEGSVRALLSHACLVLRGGEGSLARQLHARRRRLAMPEGEEALRRVSSGGVQPGSLALENGFGGFRADGGYVVHSAPPMPYANVLANERFGAILTERGGGFTFADNSRMRRVTAFASDPVRDMRAERLYLRDEDTGEYVELMDNALVTHGFGFTRFESVDLGIRLTLTIFVDAQWPVKCTLIEMENDGEDARALSLTASVQWLLGTHLVDAAQVRCELSGCQVIASSPAFPESAFFAMPGRDADVSADGAAFFGQDMKNPRGMRIKRLEHSRSDVPCGVLRTRIRLHAGEKSALCVLLGTGDGTEMARAFTGGGAQLRFAKLTLLWQQRHSALMPRVPDTAMALMLGLWFPYQALSSRIFAHAGFYQAGGAIGFRDQLQDMLALLYTEPERVRAHLLDAAAHQFEAGDVQHWWHKKALGVRTHIADDRLFLPYVATEYMRVTGDTGILKEQVPFLRDVPIEEGKEDWYGEAEPTEWRATLHEHILRAIRRMEIGERGIPLIRAGDWNDGMSAVGREGRGESVWLGFFFAYVLQEYAAYCGEKEAPALLTMRKGLMEALEAHAWDGEWYRRAWFDDGTPLGHRDGEECRIDLVVQAWAALAGARHAREALQSAARHLVDREAGILKLLDPPFDGATEPGYIRAYPKGIRENGGQYTHAAAWFIMACAKLGEKDLAWELFQMILPTTRAKDRRDATRYRVEPYVIAADVSAGEHPGRGGWTWYTGSAALLWTVGLCSLLGFEKRGNSIRLSPSAPRGWQGYSIEYRHGNTLYILRAAKGATDAGFIELVDDGGVHEAVYPLPEA